MDREQAIEKEIDYLAYEIVVPITGKPSTQYEFDAIEKYKRELGLFADKLKKIYSNDRLIPELKVLGDEEIERQIKYAFDNNPYMPVEVMLKFIVQSSCQAQRDFDIQQIEEE